MRKSVYVAFTFILLSCSKTDDSILNTPEFKEMVGTWKPITITDDERTIIVKENGEVEVYVGAERGRHFQANNFSYDNNEIVVGSDTLLDRILRKEKNGEIIGSLKMYKKSFSDTALMHIAIKIKNGIPDTSGTGIYYVRYK